MTHKTVAFAAFTMAWTIFAGQASAEDVRINELRDNRTVRLVASRRSETVGQNLIAKFVEVSPAPGKEVVVRFPAGGFTAHEATLKNLIEFCTPLPDGALAEDWHDARFEVILSIPKDAEGQRLDFARWYLVRLRMQDKKKD